MWQFMIGQSNQKCFKFQTIILKFVKLLWFLSSRLINSILLNPNPLLHFICINIAGRGSCPSRTTKSLRLFEINSNKLYPHFIFKYILFQFYYFKIFYHLVIFYGSKSKISFGIRFSIVYVKNNHSIF